MHTAGDFSDEQAIDLHAPQDQSLLEHRRAHVSAYATECTHDTCRQPREVGHIPVIGEKREPPAPVVEPQDEHSAPVARAEADDFNPQAASQIAPTTEQTLEAIAFPTFVADLIRGTFDAIVKSSILQMESFMEMTANVSMSVDEFMPDNVSDDNARGWRAARYPKHIRLQEGAAVPAEAAEEQPMPDFARDLKLPGGAGLHESSIGDILVPVARRRLAENHLKMLATLVLMGINRIVVTGGKIRATMAFHIDTSDRGRQESASSFDFRTATMAELGWSDLVFNTVGAFCVRGRRRQRRTAQERPRLARLLSNYGSATAIDLNVFANPASGRQTTFDARVVALFESFNFRWGRCFNDPHHFEYG